MNFAVRNTLMGLRRSKYLIRTILILLCFQFTAASFVSVEPGSSVAHHSFTSQKLSKSITLASLFEKTEREGEERDEDFFVDLPDFRFYNFSQIASVPTVLRTDIVSFHIQKPPLFRLYQVFLI
jgi:hypothetical protein